MSIEIIYMIQQYLCNKKFSFFKSPQKCS